MTLDLHAEKEINLSVCIQFDDVDGMNFDRINILGFVLDGVSLFMSTNGCHVGYITEHE